MTVEIQISTDMHTLSFKPDLFSIPAGDREYLGTVLYKTGNYILDMEDAAYEYSKQSKKI